VQCDGGQRLLSSMASLMARTFHRLVNIASILAAACAVGIPHHGGGSVSRIPLGDEDVNHVTE
jgi:hypothetical protein